MTRTRKLMLGAGLILVAGGAWFYYQLFISPSAAIRHAETFMFRRMRVAQLGEPGLFRFFYVTNRRSETAEGPVEERFGSEREDTLKYGSFDTEIRPTVGLGMLINPTDWFLDEEIRLRNVQSLERDDFVERLRTVVQESTHKSLLIGIHGFREAFPSAMRKTAFLGHVLDIDSPILLFDWPGNQGSLLSGYRTARRVAEESGAELAQTLELVIREIQPERLWLVANSMGAQVLVDAFGLLIDQPDLADAETEIEDVVLTAPDIDRDELDERFKEEVTALANELTVYVSSNDRALVMSRLVNRASRGGESTLSLSQLDEAERVLELMDADDERITLVDVTPVNRTRNFHNFSLETPEFFDDLFVRLLYDDTPRSRRRYRIKTPEGKVYWVLTRGR
ncbi:MAG: alpha/beta hydrolase [Deltaproteobacteria bacterium]|nr:alpha/beta hydrolase [Deltaproteobacteria bacterium]MBW2414919.1 alpha/beta hydrolase [Deltaproteobacteria bacterium]